MHRTAVFQIHIPEVNDVQNLLIFVIQVYTLHFALGCTFSCRGPENRKRVLFWSTP